MPRPSLDQIFQGTASPVPLYQPANENDRNAAIANIYEPKDNRPSLDQIFSQPKPQVQKVTQQPDNRFMADEPGYEYGGMLPFKVNTNSGEKSFAWPEMIRSPIRGLQDLQSGAQEAQVTGMPTMTQDSVNAMISMMPFAGNMPVEGTGALDAVKSIPKEMNSYKPETNKSANFLANNQGEPLARAETPSSSDVRQYASQKFQQADSQGGMLKPHITNAWADKALQVLPQSEEAKTVFGKESPITQMIDRIQTLRDKPMSLQGTLEIEKGLGDLVENNVNPANGKVDATGNQYLQLQHGLRDLWQNAKESDTLGGRAGFDSAKEGRELWAQSAKMSDIERIQNRANGTQNPAQAIRTGMNNYINNPVRTRGWSQEELAAGKAAAKSGIVSGLIKLGSNRFVAPVVGSVIGGPVGTAIGTGVAESANGLLNSRQNARVGNLLDTMASRPVVQNAMNPSVFPFPSMESGY